MPISTDPPQTPPTSTPTAAAPVTSSVGPSSLWMGSAATPTPTPEEVRQVVAYLYAKYCAPRAASVDTSGEDT